MKIKLLRACGVAAAVLIPVGGFAAAASVASASTPPTFTASFNGATVTCVGTLHGTTFKHCSANGLTATVSVGAGSTISIGAPANCQVAITNSTPLSTGTTVLLTLNNTTGTPYNSTCPQVPNTTTVTVTYSLSL